MRGEWGVCVCVCVCVGGGGGGVGGREGTACQTHIIMCLLKNGLDNLSLDCGS